MRWTSVLLAVAGMVAFLTASCSREGDAESGTGSAGRTHSGSVSPAIGTVARAGRLPRTSPDANAESSQAQDAPRPGGGVEFRVQREDATPVAGARIVLLDPPSEGPHAAGEEPETTDAGKPLVVRVPKGRWRVVARIDGDDVASEEVDVTEGGVHDVTVRIAR